MKMTTTEMATRINQIPVAVVITAAGSSTRMGGQKKEYRSLGHGAGTVLSAAAKAFVSALAPQSLSDTGEKIQQENEAELTGYDLNVHKIKKSNLRSVFCVKKHNNKKKIGSREADSM